MIRTFRYPLKPNRTQESALEGILVACQRLYNGALEARKEAYRKQRKTVTKFDQFVELAVLRAEDPIYAAVAARILRSPIDRLDKAYRAFFRRVRSGEKPGFPRFRSRDRYDSFDFPLSPTSVDGDRIRIPNMGPVKIHLYRELRGAPKKAIVRRGPKGWEVSIVCDVGDAPKLNVDLTKSTGIDLGLTHFAVLADGTEIENPRFLKAGADLIARRQRALATKKRGSNSRRRAKRLLGRAYAHVHNQRADFGRKLAKDLVSRYDVIAHEALDIRGMIEKRGINLAKSISDAAWRMFIQYLTFKAEEAGKLAIGVDPRGTTQRCSKCQMVVPKTLRDRWHVCEHCGACLGRDHNAAINIQALGLSVAREIPNGIPPTEHRSSGAQHQF